MVRSPAVLGSAAIDWPAYRRRATAIGFLAVLMWALLAALTVATGDVPPFLLTAVTFAIGGAVGLVWLAGTGRWRDLRQPPVAFVVGTSGLFLYHALYFVALDHAPAIEASLVAYLWPLLIVLLAAMLPGERLTIRHVAGALVGFAGAALIVTRGRGLALDALAVPGYLAALGCAFVWSVYSVLSRRLGDVPTATVVVNCLLTAVLAGMTHLAVEEPFRLPATVGAWGATLGLGLGPVGAAFYVWDHGVKHGDIQLLGVAAFAAPLLSALALLALGLTPYHWTIPAAAVLIALGAWIASGGAPRRNREERHDGSD